MYISKDTIIAFCILLAIVLLVSTWCCCKKKMAQLRENEIPMLESKSTTDRNGGMDVSSGIRYVLGKMKMFRDGWSSLGLIDYDRLNITESPLASGGGGVVYRGTFLNQHVAVKAVYSQMFNFQDVAEISREAAMLVRVAHPNITRLHGVSLHEGILYLVTDFVPVRLESVVELDANYTSTRMLRITRQIYEAVAFMHSRNVAHRDIKPENILLTENGEVRICDLGISQITSKLEVSAMGKSASSSFSSLHSINDHDTLGAIGTAPWAPPEASLGHLRPESESSTYDEETVKMFGVSSAYSSSGSNRSVKSNSEREMQSAGEMWDVFSLGMLTWYLWYGEKPLRHLKSANAMMKHLHKGLRPPLDVAPIPPPPLLSLIKSMWQQSPQRRLEMAAVLFRLDHEVTRELAKRHLSGEGILSAGRRRSQEEILRRHQGSNLVGDTSSPLSRIKFHEFVKQSLGYELDNTYNSSPTTSDDLSLDDDRRRALTRHSEAHMDSADLFSFSEPSDSTSSARVGSRASRAVTASVDHEETNQAVTLSPKLSYHRGSLSGRASGFSLLSLTSRESRGESFGRPVEDTRSLQQCEVVVEGSLHRCCSDGLWRKRFLSVVRGGDKEVQQLLLVMVVEAAGKPCFYSQLLKQSTAASHVSRILVGAGPNNEAKGQPPGSCFIVMCEGAQSPSSASKGVQHVFRASDSTEATRWVSGIQRAHARGKESFPPKEDENCQQGLSAQLNDPDNVIRQNTVEMFTI